MSQKFRKLEGIAIVILFVCLIGLSVMVVNKKRPAKEVISIQETNLVLYEGPKSLRDATEEDLVSANESSKDFSLLHCTDTTVTVNGYDCYVYDTNVNHSRRWYSDYMPPNARTPITYFDFEGIVEVTIKVPGIDLESASISPLNYGIIPAIDTENHTVTFTITKPDQYTIMFNNSPERAVHLFANEIETNIPSKDDKDVVYIGPGEWNIENIILEDNQTLYISGGAVIHGIVNANFAKNITVRGRGIIDGSKFKGWKGKEAYIPLKFDNCENISINDIIVLNPNAWVCQAFNSKNGTIDNIKIISSRPNGDGITLQSCQDYTVKNSFVRSWDDSLVIKNYDDNSKNIKFDNMQLWTDFAQSMEVGYETNKGKRENAFISDITFENITVFHNFHKPVISVHNADDASISGITFKNIVVENAQMGSGDGDELPYLIDINIAQSSNWSSTRERGTIKNVVIDGVDVLGGKNCASRIKGFDAEHNIDGVTLKNINVLGEKITSLEQGKFEVDEITTKNIILE